MSSDDRRAILLLAAPTAARHSRVRPLSPAEWAKVARVLKDIGRKPADLFDGRVREAVLRTLEDDEPDPDRLEGLLDREEELRGDIERWSAAGLWLLTCIDPDYPPELSRLGDVMPPAILGCGSRELLSRPAFFGLLGPEPASSDLFETLQAFGETIAKSSTTALSGTQSGAEALALLSVLKAGGEAVGLVYGGLLGHSSGAPWSDFIREGRLLLISLSAPEGGERLSLPYAQYLLCALSTGLCLLNGRAPLRRLDGLLEAKKTGWTEGLLALPGCRAAELLEAETLSREAMEDPGTLQKLIGRKKRPSASAPVESSSFGQFRPDSAGFYALFLLRWAESCEEATTAEALSHQLQLHPRQASRWLRLALSLGDAMRVKGGRVMLQNALFVYDAPPCSFYELFLGYFADGAVRRPLELAQESGLTLVQVRAWLERAVKDGTLLHQTRPLRYRLALSGQSTR